MAGRLDIPGAIPLRGSARRSLPVRVASLVVLAGLMVPAQAVAASPADTVRAEATKLYRAQRYEAACGKFREAAKLAPDDPAIAADLGLCLMKTNDNGGAIAETLRAVRLARPGGPRDDGKTRRNAYFNLGLLGVSVAAPEEGSCGKFAPTEGCDRTVYACVTAGHSAGAQQGEDFVILSVALTPEKAKPPCAEPPCADDAPGEVAGKASERSDAPVERADLELSSSEWITGAAVLTMSRPPDLRESKCTVVVADACLGIVALSCTESRSRDQKPRQEVGEVQLAAPKR